VSELAGLKREFDLQLFNQEKTEDATPKRKREAREKGQVAKSADVNAAVIMLVIIVTLYWLKNFYLDEFSRLIVFFIDGGVGWNLSEENFKVIVQESIFAIAKLLGPILVVAVVAASISNFSQVGFLVAPEAIKPKLENISPLKGFKKIFSIKSLVELVKSLLKVSIVGFTSYYMVRGNFTELLLTIEANARGVYFIVLSIIFKVAITAVVIFSVIAVLDYIFQRHEFNKQLRMSKQDVKEEFKQTEGDPQLKSKIKEKQRELATKRMMQDIPDSTVIITNPTHLAIALKYEVEQMDAPRVVAKGADLIAQKIREVAAEHDIPIIENKEVAWMLYENVEIGGEVPADLYQAVAEILVMLYRLKEKGKL